MALHKHQTLSTESCHGDCGCNIEIGNLDHCESENEKGSNKWEKYLPMGVSFTLLLIALTLDHIIPNSFFSGYFRFAWYAIAYLAVGLPVIEKALKALAKKNFFNEFTLMTVATLGAFAIKEFPEAVAVMLFYSVGELLQARAVNKAQNNIKALLDIQAETASVHRNNAYQTVSPKEVAIGETIQVKVGEKTPLDGVLISDKSSFNTSALTGESTPRTIRKGEDVLAGMINLEQVVEIKVSKEYVNSALSKILELVQHATQRKSKTESMISRFAKIYTPIVFVLALLIAIIPAFVVSDYVFSDWIYRSLVFLVISCPCALVISVPLGYFGGIGAASRYGILFKGANYLDMMSRVDTIVMDKTGTLTQGVFEVKEIVPVAITSNDLLTTTAALESQSTHPIARAITTHANYKANSIKVENVKEIAGHGLEGIVDEKRVLVGNSKLMRLNSIDYDASIDTIADTLVAVAINGIYCGYIMIADKPKKDAEYAIEQLHKQGIKTTAILSGDKQAITSKLAKQIGVDFAYGNLLPEDKLRYIEEFKSRKTSGVAFVGDGINDAPALATSDIGIAMGAMGSDAAIEVADIVIQTDQPSKISTSISIAKATRRIVTQNIALALGIKILIMLLSILGVATMWEAVFADVGVTILAVLNSVRILRMRF